MTVLNLIATQDHLEKVAKTSDPVKGLSEFVWNSLDAEATTVSVEFQLNGLGGIQGIAIRDNGSGITHGRAEADFSNLGDSWKKLARRTPNEQRAVHGKEGRGRLKFFSLAQYAKWHSVYKADDQLWSITIQIASGALGKSDVSLPEKFVGSGVGTIVEMSPLKDQFDWLLSKQAFIEFTAIFSPYLLKYPSVHIIYNGKRVDPAEAISKLHDFPPQTIVCPNRTVSDISLKVIEWNSPVEGRRIHLGGESGIVLGSQPAHVTAPGFEFSAYAHCGFFQEMSDANLLELDDLSDPDFMHVMAYLREQLGDYFRQRQSERSQGLIDELKNAGAYPYEGDPKDEVERRERQVFDIATYAVSSYSKDFKKADNSLKRMTLTLLREAIRHNPDSLSTILRAVVNLPKSRQDEFSTLLHKTELGSIISASSLIADRVTALELLKAMVFNPKHRETVRERGELDVVVRDNTWMFGERFHITLPEAGLTQIMDRVSEELGSNRKKRQVRKAKGGVGRTDCLLGRAVPHPDPGLREFIVVELKRPSLTIGRPQLDQLEDYHTALKSQLDFRHTETFWNFYLITGEYDEDVKNRIHQKDRPIGLFLENENSRVWVRTWSEIIRECESRLHFIQDKLRIEVSAEDIEQRLSSLRSSILKEGQKKD